MAKVLGLILTVWFSLRKKFKISFLNLISHKKNYKRSFLACDVPSSQKWSHTLKHHFLWFIMKVLRNFISTYSFFSLYVVIHLPIQHYWTIFRSLRFQKKNNFSRGRPQSEISEETFQENLYILRKIIFRNFTDFQEILCISKS